MIISRTPFRISFFGGGTDYPAWFQENGGAVLSCTINRFCYITARFLPPFFDKGSRIVWSKIETVDHPEEIEHPVVRASLLELGITKGVEIHHQGDLPARSGIGSSSSFTVGVFHALQSLQGCRQNKAQLAAGAINIEQNILKENVGIQDQIAASFGGLNRVDIDRNGGFEVQPRALPAESIGHLESHMLLFYTGLSRQSSVIAGETIKSIPRKKDDMTRLRDMVDEADSILQNGTDMTAFGALLDESWQRKRGLTEAVSTEAIDETYRLGRLHGAYGGKLLGAGGGGFVLFIAPPDRHSDIIRALPTLLHVPISIEFDGSQIIYNSPSS